MLTDLEAVFRGLKSDLGLRPVFHHTEGRTEGHLFITVLAYQLVQAIRHKLAANGEHLSWSGLRAILAVQQRVTATFRQRDGRTLHVRKATVAEPDLRQIYDALADRSRAGRGQEIRRMTRPIRECSVTRRKSAAQHPDNAPDILMRVSTMGQGHVRPPQIAVHRGPVRDRALIGRHIRQRRKQQRLETGIVQCVRQRPCQASAAGPVEVIADRALAQSQAICDNALW